MKNFAFNLLNPVNVHSLINVIIIVAAISVLFAFFIVIVSHFTKVKTDEKAEKIQELLSGANCGGCGYAGCADFAKALAEGRAEISGCGPTSAENKIKIAEILGQSFSDTEPKAAFVHCAGGKDCADKFVYVGNRGCVAISSAGGGNKACSFGCLGDGTCAAVCEFNAIKIVNGVAKANIDKCNNCGKCAAACPKHIIERLPVKIRVYIACSSLCKGKDVLSACKKGCIGCGICAKNCPAGAIEMADNLPKIDYTKCTGCGVCAEKCPRKCIFKVG